MQERAQTDHDCRPETNYGLSRWEFAVVTLVNRANWRIKLKNWQALRSVNVSFIDWWSRMVYPASVTARKIKQWVTIELTLPHP